MFSEQQRRAGRWGGRRLLPSCPLPSKSDQEGSLFVRLHAVIQFYHVAPNKPDKVGEVRDGRFISDVMQHRLVVHWKEKGLCFFGLPKNSFPKREGKQNHIFYTKPFLKRLASRQLCMGERASFMLKHPSHFIMTQICTHNSLQRSNEAIEMTSY